MLDPIIYEHEGFQVVRDDLVPGGTKRRAIHIFFDNVHDEYVYTSPVYGYAQIALAYAAKDHGKQATIFCAARKERYPLTTLAEANGAKIVEVPFGRLSVVKFNARNYCAAHKAKLLPFGLDDPLFIEALALIARKLPVTPSEVWSVAGSGVLTRALQLAWPDASFHAVRVGAEAKCGKAQVWCAPELFEHDAQMPPPWPSCPNYDAKLWRFAKEHAKPGALIWNVAF